MGASGARIDAVNTTLIQQAIPKTIYHDNAPHCLLFFSPFFCVIINKEFSHRQLGYSRHTHVSQPRNSNKRLAIKMQINSICESCLKAMKLLVISNIAVSSTLCFSVFIHFGFFFHSQHLTSSVSSTNRRFARDWKFSRMTWEKQSREEKRSTNKLRASSSADKMKSFVFVNGAKPLQLKTICLLFS